MHFWKIILAVWAVFLILIAFFAYSSTKHQMHNRMSCINNRFYVQQLRIDEAREKCSGFINNRIEGNIRWKENINYRAKHICYFVNKKDIMVYQNSDLEIEDKEGNWHTYTYACHYNYKLRKPTFIDLDRKEENIY